MRKSATEGNLASSARPAVAVSNADRGAAPITSLRSFLGDAGSDRGFRDLIYDLISLTGLIRNNQERFARYIGVTRPQCLMLLLISDGRYPTVGDIAARLEVSSPFVTAEVGKLVATGLVTKVANDQDRRSALLELTEAGRARVHDLGPLRRRTNDLMFMSVTAEDAERLRQIVHSLLVDGHSALHELEAPRRRNERAPSLVAQLVAAAAALGNGTARKRAATGRRRSA